MHERILVDRNPDSPKEPLVGHFNIFIIRAILGAGFAVLLTRFFHPEFNAFYVGGLAVFLIGLAYLFELFRNRNNRSGGDTRR